MIENYLQKTKNGDTRAFEFIITEYKHLVYSIALQIIKEKHLAEDVVQETFLKAYKNLKKFKGESKFSTWLYRIAVNESLSSLEKSKKLLYTKSVEDAYEINGSHYFEEGILKNERKDMVKQVMESLKPQEALILNLFYLQEQSTKEIALITGLKNEHIKVLLNRSRKAFYEKLKSKFKNELSEMR